MRWQHRETWLFESPVVRIGVIEVLPHSPAWAAECETPARPQIAFPERAIRTRLLGHARTDRIITPMHVMLAKPGGTYLRSVVDPRGEWSAVFEFSDEREGPLIGGVAQLRPKIYLDQRLLVRTLRSRTPTPVEVEETALRIARGAIAAPPLPPPPTQRAETAKSHDEMVREAWRLLDARADERLSLADVGRAVHAAPAHFARVFRAHTGQTVAAAHKAARLRRALADVCDTRDDLTAIALRWGFGDLAHFSRSFRAEFGVPPSRVRGKRA